MKPEELEQQIIALRAKAGPGLTPIIDRCLVVVRELSAQTNDEVLVNFVAGLDAALPLPVPPPEGTIGGGLAVDEDDSLNPREIEALNALHDAAAAATQRAQDRAPPDDDSPDARRAKRKAAPLP